MERAAREDRLRLLGSQVLNLSLLGTFSPRLGLKVAQRQLLVHICAHATNRMHIAWLSQAGLGDVAPMPYLKAWWKQGSPHESAA